MRVVRENKAVYLFGESLIIIERASILVGGYKKGGAEHVTKIRLILLHVFAFKSSMYYLRVNLPQRKNTFFPRKRTIFRGKIKNRKNAFTP